MVAQSADRLEPRDLPTPHEREPLIEPLAVIGFALKFPQDGDTTEGFWRILKERRDVMTPWPADRINFEAFHSRTDSRKTQNFVAGAHFLREDLGAFDASFFGISATEAASMDVQHRLLLESTYHAIENAGITIDQISGSKTGVYAGSMAVDYQQTLLKDIDDVPKYAVTGVAQSMVSNRLSWFYNLHGPSITMDSACSSSLMAFDIACQGLRNRDCDMALVAGASLVLAAETTLSLNNMKMLSPHGRSFSFDARADGYSRGEGFSVVLVKRLNDAIRDGDTIRAVVRSTGSNQDGHTPGVTQPSRDLQARLIKDTYDKAGLDLHETRFFEAHGTGTPLGDPLEADAIGSTFRTARSKADPLYIGALKSNIGHLEGGSGLAGIIKTILVLESGTIPPNANFENVNPKIDMEFLNIRFPTECVPWPSSGLRRASVASFGFGGSNSHAVLDDAYNYLRLRSLRGTHHTKATPTMFGAQSTPYVIETGPAASVGLQMSTFPGPTLPSDRDTAVLHTATINGSHLFVNSNGPNTSHRGQITREAEASTTSKSSRLLVFSAADEGGVKRLVNAYEQYFQRHCDATSEESYLDDLAYTLSTHRSSMSWKSFAVLNSVESLSNLSSSISKPLPASYKTGVAFIFTGQGAQYRNMGVGLYQYPSFRKTIELFDNELQTIGSSWSVAELLFEGPQLHDIDDPEYSQPITTALQLALCEFLYAMGVKPSVVLGHSSGEIAAAYAFGALSLASACKVSYHRGRLASALRKTTQQPGAMMSVDLSEDRLREFLCRTSGNETIHVACINSNDNVTISGDELSIDTTKTKLDAENIRARKLKTGVAYHSPHMSHIAAEYVESIAGLEIGAGLASRPSMISSVTGAYVYDIADLCNPNYWVANLVSPVQFAKAMAVMSRTIDKSRTRKLGSPKVDMIQDLVEVGPHSALRRPVLDCLEHNKVSSANLRYHSVLIRQLPAAEAALKLVGELHSRGHIVNINEANLIGTTSPTSPELLVELPSYVFNHSKSYWHEPPSSKHGRVRKAPKSELLGIPASDWNPLEPRWRKFFDLNETPWKGEHMVNGKAIYPATGMIVMAIEGAKQVADASRHISGYRIRDAVFLAPIAVGEDRSQVELHMRSDNSLADKLSTSLEFRVYSLGSAGWFENCHGFVQVIYDTGRGDDGTEGRLQENMFYREKYDEAVQICDVHVPKDHMYKRFVSNGLIYGPSFQGLENLFWDGDSTAIGDVQCFRWTDSQTENSHQHHVAHPTTLDAAGQLAWVALTKGGQEDLANGFAATRIQDMWLAASGLSYPGTDHIKVYSRATLKGLRGTDCSAFALDEAGNLVLEISHFETTTVGGDEMASQNLRPRQICFQMAYQPDMSLLKPEKLLALANRGIDMENSPVAFYQDLEMALYYFAKGARKSYIPAESHLAKYVHWLDRQIHRHEAGDLVQRRQDWLGKIDDREAMEILIENLDKTNAEGRFFMRIGRQMSNILQGLTDPLEIMFQDGLAERHYQEVCDKILCCKQLTNYLNALSHKAPQLSVLEVGAGTGSITTHVLKGLGPRCRQYSYTDVSEAFFAAARDKFADTSFQMEFRQLDIERDPLDQGYEPETYDIVVAAWVLHATHDLAETICNVRKLLKPNGKLILLEITEPQLLRNGFAFGTLPGWWLSTEPFRHWGPCASERDWSELLLTNGFESIDLVLPDYESQICHENSILIASRADEERLKTPIAGTSVTLLLTSGSSTSLQLPIAKGLQQVLEKEDGVRSRTMYLDLDDEELTKLPSGSTLVFLAELEQSLLANLNEKCFKSLQALISGAKTVVWLMSSPKLAAYSAEREMVKGLARVLATEKPSLTFVTLSFEDCVEADLFVEISSQVVSTVMKDNSPNRELEYIERNGVLMINRVYASDQSNLEVHTKAHTILKNQKIEDNSSLILTVPNPGLLDSVRWEGDFSHRDELGADEIEIEVQALGVNFRDLLVILGKFNASTVGCECAGIVTKVGTNCTGFQEGDRVCACVLGCARTHVRCHYSLAIKVPEFLSTAEAASLPITGVTAHYSLVTLANLQKGDSILIHSATGGTGQMALQIAQAIGAIVYVTVGTEEKRLLVKELYGVPEENIFFSRNTSFAKELMRVTGGKGVDVVLNSLSGEALLASWECMAPFGRFIELGKADIQSNSKLPMSRFSGEVSFHAVAVDYITEHRPAMIQQHLQSVMKLLLAGTIKVASPLHLYPVSEIETAFRIMQSGKNTGKTVLTLSPSDIVPTWIPPTHSSKLDPDVTYLIAGGLGGLGRSAARWMCQHGARYLILLSRSGAKSTAAQALVQELQQSGVTVRTPQCDVASSTSLIEALKQCEDMPPVKGCLQGTMVLQDCLFETMSWAQWRTSIRSKVPSTWNLHTYLPRDLSFFIILSSVAGIAGSMGQSNYAAGNTFQDGLAAHRLAIGEKAVSIDLGWMGDIGIVAENAGLTKGKEAAGDLAPIFETEFLALLDHYCNPDLEIRTPEQAQAIIGLVTPAQFWNKGLEPPDWLIDRSLFTGLSRNVNDDSEGRDGAQTTRSHRDWADELSRASSHTEATDIVVQALTSKLAKATSTAPEEIDPTRPLHAYGVDSLLAVEIRNWFGKVFKADVAIFDITGQGSMTKIAEGAAGQSAIWKSRDQT